MLWHGLRARGVSAAHSQRAAHLLLQARGTQRAQETQAGSRTAEDWGEQSSRSFGLTRWPGPHCCMLGPSYLVTCGHSLVQAHLPILA